MIITALALTLAPTSILIQGGMVYDGLGHTPKRADIRVKGDKIVAIGKLKPLAGDRVINVKGLAVSPGFIDAHSHADEGVADHPTNESQLRQGLTTSVVGQDGIWDKPVSEELKNLTRVRPSENFAYFSGHGGIRAKLMGKDATKKATPAHIKAMCQLVEADMKAGAIGLSTGLEYEPATYSNTEELIALSKVAAKYKGMYISHVRDESNFVFKSFDELARIGKEAKLPVQISHIKLAVASQWGKMKQFNEFVARSRKAGIDLTADVYPYLYWQSTIRVLTTSRDQHNPKTWESALRDVGGPNNVRLTTYTPNKEWEGKTLAQISASTGKSAPDLIIEIIDATEGNKGRESIVCTAMQEADLTQFIKNPLIMFCSDGSDGGSHPRGAGSFPRILGRYVREQKLISLPEAIRKMTSFPATRFGLRGRGVLAVGAFADIVVFDPAKIEDMATPENPKLFSVGVQDSMVNGQLVIDSGRLTGARPGRGLRSQR